MYESVRGTLISEDADGQRVKAAISGPRKLVIGESTRPTWKVGCSEGQSFFFEITNWYDHLIRISILFRNFSSPPLGQRTPWLACAQRKTLASCHGARIQTSRSSTVVRITGWPSAWIDKTTRSVTSSGSRSRRVRAAASRCHSGRSARLVAETPPRTYGQERRRPS